MNNALRIIGGRWRSRRLAFPPRPSLRPTPDRVRETLFNWLRDDLDGAACLDLFAGSGALGFEAASRGAAQVVLVDSDAEVCAALKRNGGLLDASDVAVIHSTAEAYLKQTAQPFEIVFLDPPFRDQVLSAISAQLESGGWLAKGAKIYLEADGNQPITSLVPANWRLTRSGQAGEVGYHLCERSR